MEKKHILCISGGKDSMATAILALEHGEPLDLAVYCEVMFDKNISGEVPEHREFIYNKMIPFLERNGIQTHIVRGEKTYNDYFHTVIEKPIKNLEIKGKKRGFPLSGRCAINRDCKTRPLQKFLKENGFDDAIQYVGIATDEPKRLERLDRIQRVSLLEKYGYTEEMAAKLCKSHDLYSPAYKYSDRNGCWFCPNCCMEEFTEFKRRHPELWQRLLDLGKTENLASYGFKYSATIEEIDQQISMDAAQIRLWE